MFFSKIVINLLIYCVCVWRPEGNSWGCTLSFHCVDSEVTQPQWQAPSPAELSRLPHLNYLGFETLESRTKEKCQRSMKYWYLVPLQVLKLIWEFWKPFTKPEIQHREKSRSFCICMTPHYQKQAYESLCVCLWNLERLKINLSPANE